VTSTLSLFEIFIVIFAGAALIMRVAMEIFLDS